MWVSFSVEPGEIIQSPRASSPAVPYSASDFFTDNRVSVFPDHLVKSHFWSEYLKVHFDFVFFAQPLSKGLNMMLNLWVLQPGVDEHKM